MVDLLFDQLRNAPLCTDTHF